MGIIWTKSELINYKITGVNKIIFEYCHYPLHFEDELKKKTKDIYETLEIRTKDNYVRDFCLSIYVHVNHLDKWVLVYKDFRSHKNSIINSLWYRKWEYDRVIGIRGNRIYNKSWLSY